MGDPELDGVVVFAPDGVMIGRIALPERCANLCFGGVKRNRLFMAASQSIYALYVNTQGALAASAACKTTKRRSGISRSGAAFMSVRRRAYAAL